MLSINTYEWRDPRLQWDPSDHEGLEELTLDQDLASFSIDFDNYSNGLFFQVWIPDIAVMYAVQTSTQLHSMYKVKLSPNGRVHFQPTLSQKLFCEPNYDGWPYGLQNCTFKVASYHYSKKDILVKKAVDFQPPPRQVLMSQIQIVDTKMEDFLDSISEESYVKVSIIFKGVMHQNASSSSSTGAAGTSSSAATTSDIGKNIHTSQALILLIILLLLQPNIIIDFV